MAPEPTITLLNSLALFGGAQGIIFAFILLGLGKNNKRANLYLAIILGALGLNLLDQFSTNSGYIYKVPYLLGVASLLETAVFPAIYLYVRTMTVANSKALNRLWVIVPIIFVWALLLPYLTADFETKLALMSNTYVFNELPVLLQLSYPAVLISFALMFMVYIALSFKLLFMHTKNIAHFFSYREDIELAWLRNFLLVMVVFYIFLPYFGANTEAYVASRTKLGFVLLTLFSVMAIFYLGVMGLLQPSVYKSNTAEITVAEPEGSRLGIPDKYKKSALDKPQSERILKRLLSVMDKQRPYLKSNLTLPDLAILVSTSPNYLSQVINEQLQMSFFDYINSHRIEMAKELLITPLPHTQTVLDVAMASAFNSKSAFYSAFKKQMGITPAQFKKNTI